MTEWKKIINFGLQEITEITEGLWKRLPSYIEYDQRDKNEDLKQTWGEYIIIPLHKKETRHFCRIIDLYAWFHIICIYKIFAISLITKYFQ